jgi:hypothetical protein
MHSHVLPNRPGPRSAAIGRRLARRAGAMAAGWQARPRTAAPWAGLDTSPFDADRVAGESYRDYLFRKGVGSSAP